MYLYLELLIIVCVELPCEAMWQEPVLVIAMSFPVNLGKHFSSLALPDPILKNREGVRGQTQNYTEV